MVIRGKQLNPLKDVQNKHVESAKDKEINYEQKINKNKLNVSFRRGLFNKISEEKRK